MKYERNFNPLRLDRQQSVSKPHIQFSFNDHYPPAK